MDHDAGADPCARDRGGLLVVHHSRTGGTWALTDAAVTGAAEAVDGALDIRVLGAFEAGPQEVLRARGLLLATPARFGYMSGALKDFFERIYHPCLEETRGLPYALLVKGDTDTGGAVSSVARIATGLAWRQVLPPLEVVGVVDEEQRLAAAELGATLAAGLEAGIF
jgi:NAD(P)H-dependent FMN reductase